MEASVGIMLGLIALAGGAGGAINRWISGNKNKSPAGNIVGKDMTNMVPSNWPASVVLGAIAALVSWLLYGPLTNYVVIATSGTSSSQPVGGLSLASLAGALLVGMGGGRFLSDLAEKAVQGKLIAKLTDALPPDDPLRVRLREQKPG